MCNDKLIKRCDKHKSNHFCFHLPHTRPNQQQNRNSSEKVESHKNCSKSNLLLLLLISQRNTVAKSIFLFTIKPFYFTGMYHINKVLIIIIILLYFQNTINDVCLFLFNKNNRSSLALAPFFNFKLLPDVITKTPQ